MSTPKTTITEEVDPTLLDPREESTTVILDQAGFQEHEVPTMLQNPFGVDLPRFTPNFQVMTLERFIVVANQVIQDAQAREQIVESERVRLVEEYPAEEMDRIGDEVIVYRVKSRKPANLSPTGNSRPARGYIHEYTVRSSEHPNKSLDIEKRLLDHQIEFAVWSKSATLANRRALWLERLFVNHRWAFEEQGADRFYWTGREIDQYQTTNGQRLHKRPLIFFLRIPEFRIKAKPILKHIEYQIKTSDTDTFQNSSRID